MALITLENFAAIQSDLLGVGTKMCGAAVFMLGFDYVMRMLGSGKKRKKKISSDDDLDDFTVDASGKVHWK